MGAAFVDEYKHKYLEGSLCYASLAKQQYSLLTLYSLRPPIRESLIGLTVSGMNSVL